MKCEAPPFKGMKFVPEGLPLMLPAWLGCVSWALSKDEMIEDFYLETGINLKEIGGENGFNQKIDEETGRTRAEMVAWFDWVTENIWGKLDAGQAGQAGQAMGGVKNEAFNL